MFRFSQPDDVTMLVLWMRGVLPAALLVAAGACAATGGRAVDRAGTASTGLDSGSSFDSVAGIFETRCNRCHGDTQAGAGLRLDTWNHVLRGSDAGEVVIPFAPDHSLLLELATKRVGGAHPSEAGEDAMTAAELATMREWIESGAPSPSGEIAYHGVRNFVYVANQGEATISVIDAQAQVVVRVVDLKKLGFSEMAKPHHIAVEPDGSHWYVSLIGENRVLKFDSENKLVDAAEFEVPGMLAFDAGRRLLYVGRSMSAVHPPSRIGVISAGDMTADEIDVFVPRPHALMVASTGKRVYTASLSQNTVVNVDADTWESTLFDIGGNPEVLVQFAQSPDGTTLAASAQLSGRVFFLDVSQPPNVSVRGTVQVGGMPWHPTHAANGAVVFVPNKGSSTISVVSADSLAVIAEISGNGLSEPHGSVLSPDGKYLFVTSNNAKGAYQPRHPLGDNDNVGTATIVDTDTHEIVKVLEVGTYATGVGARKAW